MMFSFNFGSENKSDSVSSDDECDPVIEIKPTEKHSSKSIDSNSLFLDRNVELKTITNETLLSSLETNSDISIQRAEDSHSDLLPGVYEGGLKIWECTFDLCNYLINESNAISFEGKNVLDLGCGAGILGILAKKQGANIVDFQDYNSGVLKHLTIPNVELNCSSLCNTKFFSGDWGGLKQLNQYDYILTSETIYNSKNYSKLHRVFKENLKPDGIIYVAAKLYYFGVGGSIGEFCSLIEKKNIFECKQVFSSEEGVKRAILQLRFKTS